MPESTLRFQKGRDLPIIAHEVHLLSTGRMSVTSHGESFLYDLAVLYLALQHWEDGTPSTHAYDTAVSELVSAALLEASERLAVEMSGLDDRAFQLQDRSSKRRCMEDAAMVIAEAACDIESSPEPEVH